MIYYKGVYLSILILIDLQQSFTLTYNDRKSRWCYGKHPKYASSRNLRKYIVNFTLILQDVYYNAANIYISRCVSDAAFVIYCIRILYSTCLFYDVLFVFIKINMSFSLINKVHAC